MTQATLTPVTRKALVALSQADNGSCTWPELRAACGVTLRGWHIARNKMLDAGLIDYAPDDGLTPRLTITFRGLCAINEVAL